jgi:hypothetical protein
MSSEGRQFMRNFAVTLTAEPVFGRTLTLAECSEVLAKISLGAVVGRLALFKHVNEEVLGDPDASIETRKMHTRRMLHTLLDAPHVTKALADANNDPNFRPVSDQALLATLELALCCCPRGTDKWITGNPLRLELAHVLLSFQSALFSRDFHARADKETSFESLGAEGQAEFIRNTLAHNLGLYSRHAIGRLYAFCRVPAVTDAVLARTGQSVHDWFVETFQLTPDEYLCCAFLAGGPAKRLNLNEPDPDALAYNEDTYWQALKEPERSKVKSLLSLATQMAGEPKGAPGGDMDQFLYAAGSFHVRPVLTIPPVSICISPDLMLRKFLFGLPYLAQEGRVRTLGRPLNDGEFKRCRAAVGILFEAYVVWLVRQLLEPVPNMRIFPNVTYGPKGERRETDLVIICGDTALVLETKTTMASLNFRKTGRFEDLDVMLQAGAVQAYRAARALRAGQASDADGQPIEGARWVIPCVVTYDDIPLFEPISVFYERHLTEKTKLPLFVAADGVEAVQFFDVDFLESWEEKIDLSPGSRAVFGYLTQRARQEDLRYRKLRSGIVTGPSSGAPRPFNGLVENSRVFMEQAARSWLRK